MSPEVYRILLIEDNEGDAVLLREMLEENALGSFSLEYSGCLTEGIGRLEEGVFDLVLLDLGLPESCGIETFHRIKAACPGMPVIVLTSLDDEIMALSVVTAGAQDYLLKGQTDGTTLRRAIRYAVERKNAEKLLRFTQYAVDHSMLGVFWIGKDGRFVNINQGACTMLGYTREELLSMGVEDIDAGHFLSMLNRLWKQAPTQGSVGLQSLYRKKDGGYVPVEIVADYVEYDGSGYVYTSVYDITERTEADQALRASEARYRQLFEDNPLPAFIFDMETLKVLDANKAALRQYGYDRKEFLSLSVVDLRPDEALGELMRGISLSDEEVQKVPSFRHKRKDGTVFEVIVSAHSMALNGRRCRLILAMDITERKRTEEALQFTQFAVDNAVDAAYWTTPDGRLFYVNNAACHSLGYTSQELLAMSIHDIDTNVSAEQWPDYWNRLKDQKRLVMTTSQRTKEGKTLPVEITAHYVEYGQREFNCAFARNIAERLLAEEEKNKLQVQLLHAQKMEAIGQLAGGIAHDFNNILTGIIGYGNLLQMSLSADTPSRAYADSILSSGEKAAKLTQSLLAFSRKQSIQQAPQSLHESLRSLEPLLRRLITEDIDFHMVYHPTDLTIFADSVQIDQVIINLVTNARDAMPHGGTLIVRTSRMEVSQEQAGRLGLKEPGSYVILSIEDSGTGMSEEVQARLFDPFFTTKEVGQGTGLGLSIVYGIVGQHGGAISVHSQLGRGSQFDVFLPAHETTVARKNLPLLQPIGGNETILLAEDDENVRKMVSTILNVSGYSVVEAIDGEDALLQFGTHQNEIDLVILDVIMPKRNGREVCDWIRERKPGMRFLFTSGYTKNIIDEKGFSEEGVNFISKPVHPNDLLNKIREVLQTSAND